MFKRQQFDILKNRIAEQRRFIQVVAGPRQIGKSTMVKQVLEEINMPHHFFTSEDTLDKNPQWIIDCWNGMRQALVFNHYKEMLIVFDEIHKIDNWSETVKGEWDKDTMSDVNIKVVLLGSSRLLLKDGLTESLAGRFELIEMEHWSYAEMQSAFGFSLEQYIYFGGYPGGASLINDEMRWRKYIKNSIVEPAITKDVLFTKRIYKPALMRQLFELGCGYSGELLSFNKLLGQLQGAGNTDTLANYLRVLDESCLLAGLQKYAVDMARKYNSIPKYQVYNSALLTAETSTTLERTFTTPQMWGRWVETAIGMHLINNAKRLEYKLYYWRENNLEVDFIIERGDMLLSIEVKSGRRKDNRGIHEFEQRFHPSVSLVVGGYGITIEQFLLADPAVLFQMAK